MQEMYMLHMIIYTLLAFTLVVPNGIYAGNCDGETANEMIIEKPSSPFHVVEGNDVSLSWTYCKAKTENPITRFIIYLDFYFYPRKKLYLVSMDFRGTFYNKSKNNRLDFAKKDETVTFVIKDTVIQDSGFYRLQIRREGSANPYSRIEVRVIRKPDNVASTKIYHEFSNITSPISPSPTIATMTWSSVIKTSKKYLNSSQDVVTSRKCSNITSTISSSPTITARAWSAPSMIPESVPLPVGINKQQKWSTFMIVIICIAAALVPPTLFCIVYLVVKLIRRQKKKRKANITTLDQRASHHIQSTETEPINVHESQHEPRVIRTVDFQNTDEMEVDEVETTTVIRPSTKNYIHQDVGCPSVPNRKNYEINRGLIQNLQIIGQGAFGLVAKADLYEETKRFITHTVAVKMLKEFASGEDRKALISELKLMQGIDSHENVVELLGCVTVTEPIWVITGYAARGDLLGFLRRSRGVNDTTYRDLVSNPKTSLSPKHLLQMSKDIACGMTYVSQKKIIHRDLAARNVLVDENIQCKITDFGMARDVKSTNYYRTRNRGRIPLKWTAIEALLHDKYTTKSDVWSYGIVLYEIVTIGGSPYPTMGPREILRKLKEGWRMKKPCHVNDQLYDIMCGCWVTNPDDRPSFSDLSTMFSSLLGGCNHNYINMKEYNGILHGRIEESTSGSSGLSVDEVAV